MLKSEKKSLIRFLLIYLLSTFLLFALAGIMFYSYETEHILDKQKDKLSHQAQKIKTQIRALHNTFDKALVYPASDVPESAIYDSDKNYIMGTYKQLKVLDEDKLEIQGNRLFYISKVEPYYLGAAYLLVTKEIDDTLLWELQKSIYLFMLIAGIFFLILGIFLGRLFIAPMRSSMEKMNRFIEDTTHELNTPIGTILANIEILESSDKYGASKELNRIEIASKTLSRIYDDLTYLTFNHKYNRCIEHLNVSDILEERIAYFASMSDIKQIKFDVNIEPSMYLDIDNNDLLRVIDNLISNAIKYNKLGGTIEVRLTNRSLLVRDTGIGISKTDIEVISQRFKRANDSEGGFGLGLDIINQIVMYYTYVLEINSTLKEGTTMEIRWKR